MINKKPKKISLDLTREDDKRELDRGESWYAKGEK